MKRPSLPFKSKGTIWAKRCLGTQLSSCEREKRLWPPGVTKAARWPASAQRRKVAGATPSNWLAWPRLSQSPSVGRPRSAARAVLSIKAI